jgi:hypothetical protein
MDTLLVDAHRMPFRDMLARFDLQRMDGIVDGSAGGGRLTVSASNAR